MFRLLYANLGYARDIDGSLWHHVSRATRYLYTPRTVQEKCMAHVQGLMDHYDPHLSCFVEIDKGSLNNGWFNQMSLLHQSEHQTVSVDNKYSPIPSLRRFSISRGKANGFIASVPVKYDKHYWNHGTKRLVYEIETDRGVTIFVVHCSLRPEVREQQFIQLKEWIDACENPVVVVGDFNIFQGREELAPLLEDGSLAVVNDMTAPTFRFGSFRACLDLVLASKSIVPHVVAEVVGLPTSDHEMMVVDVDLPDQ